MGADADQDQPFRLDGAVGVGGRRAVGQIVVAGQGIGQIETRGHGLGFGDFLGRAAAHEQADGRAT